MSNFKKFTQPNGFIYVNLDNITVAKSDGTEVELRDETESRHTNIKISVKEFEDAIAQQKKSSADGLSPLITRLTAAIDRLSVRIPTSIRLHM